MTYYDDKRAEGTRFENYLIPVLKPFGPDYDLVFYRTKREQYEIGETTCGLEVKRDGRMADTGNIYFEVAEKSDGRNERWIASGVFRRDSCPRYGIGNETHFLVFTKERMRRIAHTRERTDLVIVPRLAYPPGETLPTSKGFTLPIPVCIELAIDRFTIVDGVATRAPCGIVVGSEPITASDIPFGGWGG